MKKISTAAERDAVWEQACELRNAVDKYDDAIKLEANKTLLGNCYIYPNRYSSNETWNLYQRVVRAEGRYITLFRFQTDSNGRIEIEPNARGYSIDSLGKPCTVAQFNQAWRRLHKRLMDFPHG